MPPRQSHAAVVVQDGKEVWLLDTSEETPLLLSGPKGSGREWLENIQYIAVFELEA